jgi:hypothetical protein
MDCQLHFHPLAKEDYKEAFAWYESGPGERLANAVRNKLEDIISQPKAYSTKGNIKFREAKLMFFIPDSL